MHIDLCIIAGFLISHMQMKLNIKGFFLEISISIIMQIDLSIIAFFLEFTDKLAYMYIVFLLES